MTLEIEYLPTLVFVSRSWEAFFSALLRAEAGPEKRLREFIERKSFRSPWYVCGQKARERWWETDGGILCMECSYYCIDSKWACLPSLFPAVEPFVPWPDFGKGTGTNELRASKELPTSKSIKTQFLNLTRLTKPSSQACQRCCWSFSVICSSGLGQNHNRPVCLQIYHRHEVSGSPTLFSAKRHTETIYPSDGTKQMAMFLTMQKIDSRL